MMVQALLGPLEQQEVSIAKAGVVASLPARTSLLAAANPAGGSYDRAKTLLQNLKMSPAMLSRFDILCVLLDQPDERRDQRLSEHVMAMHSGKPSSAQTCTRLCRMTADHQLHSRDMSRSEMQVVAASLRNSHFGQGCTKPRAYTVSFA